MDINGPLYSRDWLLIRGQQTKRPFILNNKKKKKKKAMRAKKAQQVILSLFSFTLTALIGPGDRYPPYANCSSSKTQRKRYMFGEFNGSI